jgi:2-dehydrotetronate isomerase
MPRLAANLSLMFNEFEFLDRFAAARERGFVAVEYLFPYAWPKVELSARLNGEGLRQVLFNAPPGDVDAGDCGLAGVPGREDEFRRSMELALDYAVALKCPRIHVMAGNVPKGASMEAHRATFIANLQDAAALARQADVQLMVEALNPLDFPGYLIGSLDIALDVVEAVGAANVFLQYDLYHCQMMRGQLAATMREKLGLIGHMQIAGVPGRNEPDASQEINYPMLLSLMDGLGYQGWVGCEYRPRGDTVAGLVWATPWGIGPGAARH